MKEKISGCRIYLQKPETTADFAKKLFDIADANRETVLPWLDWALPEIIKTQEDELAFIQEADKAWKTGKRYEYVIHAKSDNDILGIISLMNRDEAFEIAYWLKKDAQGNGYMQEAIKLIEECLFANGVKKLIINADAENKQSNNVALKAGYRFEGLLKKSRYNMCLHQFRDMNLYSKIFATKTIN